MVEVSELTWISKSPLTPFCQRGVLKYHGRLNWTLSGFAPYEGKRKNGKLIVKREKISYAEV
jgi:hypothetical protein